MSVECVMNGWSNACSLIKKLEIVANIYMTVPQYCIVKMS